MFQFCNLITHGRGRGGGGQSFVIIERSFFFIIIFEPFIGV